MKFSFAFLIASALSGAVNIRAGPARSSSELHDVLDEFLALVPREKVINIFLEYLANDPEVQVAVEYIKTDGFKELVQKVEKIDDIIIFYDYLDDSGLDIYGLVNKFHDLIGLPPLVPGKLVRNVRITGGIAGLIADIKFILPLEDIKAFYHEKLETSPAFAQLVERFRSPKFQKLIDALRANKEFQKIVKFCYEAGVDIKAIKDLLTTIFGLEFPDRRFVPSFHPSPSLEGSTGGLTGYLTDIKAILPVQDVEVIHKEELKKLTTYTRLEECLQSQELKHFVSVLRTKGKTRVNINDLKSCDINFNAIANLITNILNAAGNIIQIINSAGSQ